MQISRTLALDLRLKAVLVAVKDKVLCQHQAPEKFRGYRWREQTQLIPTGVSLAVSCKEMQQIIWGCTDICIRSSLGKWYYNSRRTKGCLYYSPFEASPCLENVSRLLNVSHGSRWPACSPPPRRYPRPRWPAAQTGWRWWIWWSPLATPRWRSHGNRPQGSRVPGYFHPELRFGGWRTPAGGDHCPAPPERGRENNWVASTEMPHLSDIGLHEGALKCQPPDICHYDEWDETGHSFTSIKGLSSFKRTKNSVQVHILCTNQ